MLLNLFTRLTASPNIVSSNEHPRYLTLECCLVYISSYFMWSFLYFSLLNFKAKSIGFVLSSPKCMVTLLYKNQSHILQKSSFNFIFWFSILSVPLCWQTRHESSALRKRSHLTACRLRKIDSQINQKWSTG